MRAPTDVHRVRQVVDDPDPYVECQRCKRRWPIDVDLFVLSRKRCLAAGGTGPQGKEPTSG